MELKTNTYHEGGNVWTAHSTGTSRSSTQYTYGVRINAHVYLRELPPYPCTNLCVCISVARGAGSVGLKRDHSQNFRGGSTLTLIIHLSDSTGRYPVTACSRAPPPTMAVCLCIRVRITGRCSCVGRTAYQRKNCREKS